jgi:hypothetical protein
MHVRVIRAAAWRVRTPGGFHFLNAEKSLVAGMNAADWKNRFTWNLQTTKRCGFERLLEIGADVLRQAGCRINLS